MRTCTPVAARVWRQKHCQPESMLIACWSLLERLSPFRPISRGCKRRPLCPFLAPLQVPEEVRRAVGLTHDEISELAAREPPG